MLQKGKQMDLTLCWGGSLIYFTLRVAHALSPAALAVGRIEVVIVSEHRG